MSLARCLIILPAVFAVAALSVPAGVTNIADKQPAGNSDPDEIVQEFPGAGGEKTAWKVQYKIGTPRPGLVITGAWIKTDANAKWFQVLGEVRLSEIFVPYNDGETRLFDIGAQGDYDMLTHTQADAGVNGQLLNKGLVVKEVRDTGVLWKNYEQVRRGQELVLWATTGAANYNYLVEYAFRCEGTITCRLGSTGKNLANHEMTGHMHHACWRIDMNIGDKDRNSVAIVRHREERADKGKAEDTVKFLKTEGGIEWRAEDFTRIRVESNQKNGQNKPVAYELVPLRPGTPRHYGPGEEFTAYDFWVTPYQFEELYYCNLPLYTKQARNIANTDVVLWYMSPAYHLPRDEDGVFENPQGRLQVRGVALATWCGLEMRPRNVFEKTPLYP